MNDTVKNSTGQAFNIFISYRREDTAGHAGRLYDRLASHFGEAHIFRDLDAIELGKNFKEAIDEAISTCEVLLVLIGKQWLAIADETGRRLDNPNDFVRAEIAAALKRGIKVIPVLVQGATIPRPTDLPEPLVGLSERNALEISDTRWSYDVGRLIEALEKEQFGNTPLERSAGAKSVESPSKGNLLAANRKKLLWGGILILIVLISAFAIWKMRGSTKTVTNNYVPTSPNVFANDNTLTIAQRVAGEQINKDAKFAVEYLDQLFESHRNVPPIQMVTSDDMGNEWKEGKYEVGSRVQHFPDLTYLNMSHPFILDSVNFDFQGQSGSLQMHYATILASLIKQKRLGQTALNADWVLAEGYALQAGKASANSDARLILTSLRDPNDKNSAYAHAPHISQLLTDADDNSLYLNANIPNKAFYETAMRIGSDEAGKIWLKTLREKLLPTSTINDLAKGTSETAGKLYGDKSKERQATKDAWNIVGITVE